MAQSTTPTRTLPTRIPTITPAQIITKYSTTTRINSPTKTPAQTTTKGATIC